MDEVIWWRCRAVMLLRRQICTPRGPQKTESQQRAFCNMLMICLSGCLRVATEPNLDTTDECYQRVQSPGQCEVKVPRIRSSTAGVPSRRGGG